MKKPKPVKKAAGKKAAPWAPVPVSVQRKQHQVAVRTWKPTPVSVQRKRHLATVKAGKTRAKGKVRKLSPGYEVACCTAQAVGTLLGLTDAEVLALYGLTADGPDDGASILDTLEALREVMPSEPCDWHGLGHKTGAGLILGAELPGPHAIAVAPDGTWWSWGEPFNPDDWPDMVIDEAWAVTL